MSGPARRKVCVVTGSRADYGIIYWLLKAIAGDPDLTLQLVATGMHLSPEFGLTYRQIEADGFRLDAKVESLLSADTHVAVAKSLGLGIIGFADAFAALAPDIVIVMGDRFEIIAAAQAALLARIPVAHIHGGETSENSFDESLRHAMTKMAQWHFVAAEAYRKRVVQMGEAPERVFNVGAPGLDPLRKMTFLTRDELAQSLGGPLGKPLFVVTYHPATLAGAGDAERAMGELLAALDRFPKSTVIFTYPNADTGGRALIAQIDAYVKRNPGRARAFVSLGSQRYLSLVREADVMIGNSSSGLIEAPALATATVNIGDRQKGRLRSPSVIDVEEESGAIAKAIERALSPGFVAALSSTASPYGRGDASAAILAQLKRALPPVQKPFFDIAHGH